MSEHTIQFALVVCPDEDEQTAQLQANSLLDQLDEAGLTARRPEPGNLPDGAMGDVLEWGRLVLEFAEAAGPWLEFAAAAANVLAAWLAANASRATVIKHGDVEIRLDRDMSEEEIIDILRKLKDTD